MSDKVNVPFQVFEGCRYGAPYPRKFDFVTVSRDRLKDKEFLLKAASDRRNELFNEILSSDESSPDLKDFVREYQSGAARW